MSDDKNELLDHDYDGIKEYDNDLPRWWVWLFWVTIIASIAYTLYFDFGPGEFASEKIVTELKQQAAAKVANSSTSTSLNIEQVLLPKVSDPQTQTLGAKVFQEKCAVCHGQHGEGLIGPNLTDNYWIHGGTIGAIHRVIQKGVLEKGMLAWETTLPPTELEAVVVAVWNLHGTSPVNPKASEGILHSRD